jgi:hypothetical protein
VSRERFGLFAAGGGVRRQFPDVDAARSFVYFIPDDGSGETPMKRIIRIATVLAVAFAAIPGPAPAVGQSGVRSQVYDLGTELERQATALAQESFEHFRGWNGAISDQEQAILFKSEAFAASCRLFLKLAETSSTYFRSDHARTNIYSAFTFLVRSFAELEDEMQRGGIRPYALSDCKTILNRMERGFGAWPDPNNLAYLDQKYVKAANATVYLIEKRGLTNFIRRPFKSLESLFRYNYDRNRGKNPWESLVEVSEETLEKMKIEAAIDLTFEGRMIIEQSARKNRPVYVIENGKRRPIANTSIVERRGGWSKVFEVPREVIDSYQEGEIIN